MQKSHIKTTPSEIINIAPEVDEVSCDGGGGALGHPMVWYSFDGRDQVTCLYCDRIFTKKPLQT